MSRNDFLDVYTKTSSVHIQHEGTDLHEPLIHEIRSNILGEKVLDAGCGQAVLARLLSEEFKVTGCDIIIDKKTVESAPRIEFKEATIQSLPFNDQEFDTVICTHTLEHVQHIIPAIRELRRVAGTRLIIVLPKERPYRYTFNLHLHFFPYKYLVDGLFRQDVLGGVRTLKEIDGCWYYQEDTVG